MFRNTVAFGVGFAAVLVENAKVNRAVKGKCKKMSKCKVPTTLTKNESLLGITSVIPVPAITISPVTERRYGKANRGRRIR